MKKMTGLICILLVLLLKPAPAGGDAGFVGRFGETIQPLKHTRVEMMAEEITATVNPIYTSVEAVFTFHNHGPATTVLMGFPELPGGRGRPGELALQDFRAYVDGEEVTVQKEEGLRPETSLRKIDFPFWYTWETDFAEGETKIIKNTHRAPNNHSGVICASTGYIMTTGATWHGPIGKARVTFVFQDITPGQFWFITPPGFRLENGNLVWEWSELNPQNNLEIVYCIGPDFYLSEEALEMREKWEGKLAAAGHGEVLQEASGLLENMAGEGQNDMYYLACFYKGRACAGLDQTDLAIAAWLELLAELDPLSEVSPYEPEFYFVNEAGYHLAALYHDTGQEAALEDLCHRLRDARYNTALRRIVEAYLPAEKAQLLSPVVREISFDDGYLRGEIEDPDANLAGISLTLWKEAGGEKEQIAELQLPLEYLFVHPGEYPTHSWLHRLHYPLKDIIPADVESAEGYFCAVELVDFAGNRSSTGALEIDWGRYADPEEEAASWWERWGKKQVGEEPPQEKEPAEEAPGAAPQAAGKVYWLAGGGVLFLVLLCAGGYFIRKRRFVQR